MNTNTESNSNLTVAAAAVVALAIGGIGGFLLAGSIGKKPVTTSNASPNYNQLVQPDTTTRAADLRALLNNLDTEHVALVAITARASIDGDKSLSAASKSLDSNSKAIADAVGSIYGQKARDEFYGIWANYAGDFINYAVAVKAGNKAKMAKAAKSLNNQVEAVAAFLSRVNPSFLPKENIAKPLAGQVMLLRDVIDAHAAGKYAESYKKQHDADVRIGVIADTIASAIVKQKPENY